MVNQHKYVSWDVCFDMVVQIEIDTDQITPYLPKRIHSVEVRPNRSLLAIGVCFFNKGNIGYLPEFQEIFWGVISQVDISKNSQGLPTSAYYTVNVSATSDEFLEYAYKVDKMPIYQNKNLKIKYLSDPIGIEVEDDDGPIFIIKNTNQTLIYQEEDQIVQAYSSPDRNEEIFFNQVQWIGSVCQHQKKGDWGQLYNHPFFMGLDVESVKKNDCYMQIISEFKSIGMRFFVPQKIHVVGKKINS